MWPHVQFPKMPASSNHESVGNLAWVATEKVHGANLCLSSDGETVRGAKRRGLLHPDDDFFGWQRIEERHGDHVRELARATGSVVYVFGEIYGGGYPHPDVPAAPVAPVQPGIHYAPDVQFSVFDIAQPPAQGDVAPRWWPFERVRDATRDHALELVPVLAEGPWPVVEAIDPHFVSVVPTALGLPPLASPSLAEGLVLRTLGPTRIIVKRKAAHFAEIADLPRPVAADPVALLTWELMRRVTLSRLMAARSKLGTSDLDAVVTEAVADAWIEVHAGPYGDTLGALQASQQTTLWNEACEGFRALV